MDANYNYCKNIRKNRKAGVGEGQNQNGFAQSVMRRQMPTGHADHLRKTGKLGYNRTQTRQNAE